MVDESLNLHLHERTKIGRPGSAEIYLRQKKQEKKKRNLIGRIKE